MKSIAKPYTVYKEKLESGEKITLPPHAIKTEKHLTFSFDLDKIGDGKIVAGHGIEVSSGSWVEITATELKAYSYYSYTDPTHRELLSVEHGLDIKDVFNLVIDVNPLNKMATVIISTATGMVKQSFGGWDGCMGEIFATVDGLSARNCKFTWFSDGFTRKIWVLGDSYLGFGHSARWPYYLYRDGFNNNMLIGFPGMSAHEAISEFEYISKCGTPEYAVWCLGMNNADLDGKVSEIYLKSTKRFLEICKEKGITPILSTIPLVVERENKYKNEWVRSQPYRYIDFARAVGADKEPVWYPDMLCSDKVHPLERGAAALYMQVLCDFPEIMQRPNT